MNRDIEALSSREFDVLIIGGGIFGACAAWDACLRGYSVALIEKDDFCSGVSANSYKVVHGGIRYIQHGDIVRLRSSCRERSALLRVAPHLVKPLPILIPTYGYGTSGKAFLAAGMYLYDLLTLDRNRKTKDPARAIPWTSFLGRDEVLREFPDLQQDGLTGGAVFNDGQIYNPTRLVLSFIKSSMDHGACVSNYVEAVEILKVDGAAVGVKAHDRDNDKSFDIRAKVVLNAAGPWAERLLHRSEVVDHGPEITYSRDTCFLINRRFTSNRAVAIQGQTHDPDAWLSRPARHLFLFPWRNYTVVGVWHVVLTTAPDEITVEGSEIQTYIDEINWAYPSLGLTLKDVTMWNAGLVPFGENEPGQKHLSYGKRSHILDHSKSDGVDNLVSLIGVRYTMARGDAEKAMDLVTRKLGKNQFSPPTDSEPVSGGDIDDFDGLLKHVIDAHGSSYTPAVLTALVHNYGNRYAKVLRYDDSGPDASPVIGDTTTLRAEIHHALENEMVSRLSDLVFRRTDLATGGHPGGEVLRECAKIMAHEKGWSDDRMEEEIREVNARFPHFDDQ